MATAKRAAKASTKTKPKGNPGKTKQVSTKGSTKTAVVSKGRPASKRPTGRPAAGMQVDWDAIERDYRTGKFTDPELSTKHGVSVRRIEDRRAKARAAGSPWRKDLKDIIRAETDAALVAAAVGQERENVGESVLAIAAMNKEVILGHRRDIRTLRDYAFGLLKELVLVPEFKEVATDILREVHKVAQQPLDESETPEARTKRLNALLEQQGRLRKVIHEVADIHERVSSTRGLTDALTKLQTLERKAFDLDRGDGNASYEALLEQALA